jgi:hypothetical protein
VLKRGPSGSAPSIMRNSPQSVKLTVDHPNTIDGLHFTSTLPFVSAVRILPRERRTIQAG